VQNATTIRRQLVTRSRRRLCIGGNVVDLHRFPIEVTLGIEEEHVHGGIKSSCHQLRRCWQAVFAELERRPIGQPYSLTKGRLRKVAVCAGVV